LRKERNKLFWTTGTESPIKTWGMAWGCRGGWRGVEDGGEKTGGRFLLHGRKMIDLKFAKS